MYVQRNIEVCPCTHCCSGKGIFSVFVCSLGYPACNVHVPYCHLWPIQLYCIFPHYLINSKIFSKTSLKIKCTFSFSVQHLSKKFLILTVIQQDIIINVYRSSCKVPIFLSDFNETRIFYTGFEKYLNIKFNKNLSSGSQVVPCRQTDRHNKADSRFSQLCEHSKKPVS